MNKSLAICPGSFDPVTLGHLDVISRASGMFEKVIVVILKNANKTYSFSPEERAELLKKTIKAAGLNNVEVDAYDGLLADYAKKHSAKIILKGLRAMSDFEYEFQMALANKKLNPDIETIFITTAAENMYLSSSMVKQIASMDGDISGFVPSVIHKDILERLSKKKG